MDRSIFSRPGEGEETAILRRWSSRGLGTPEVKIPLHSCLIGQNPLKFLENAEHEEQQQQIQARGHLTWETSHDMITSISFQVSIYTCQRKNDTLHCFASCFIKEKPFCHPTVLPKNAPVGKKEQKLQNSCYYWTSFVCVVFFYVEKVASFPNTSIIFENEHNFGHNLGEKRALLVAGTLLRRRTPPEKCWNLESQRRHFQEF